MKNPFIQITTTGPLTVYVDIQRIISITDRHNTGSPHECEIFTDPQPSSIHSLDTFASIKSKIEAFYLP